MHFFYELNFSLADGSFASHLLFTGSTDIIAHLLLSSAKVASATNYVVLCESEINPQKHDYTLLKSSSCHTRQQLQVQPRERIMECSQQDMICSFMLPPHNATRTRPSICSLAASLAVVKDIIMKHHLIVRRCSFAALHAALVHTV